MNYLSKNGWNLQRSGSTEVWLHHRDDAGEHFVARFKYARPGANATAFAKFLVANFTPAEFFAERAAGKSPLPILEAKGFVSPNQLAARAYARSEAA